MKLRERLAAADRWQHSRWFKIAASVLVLLTAAAVVTTYAVRVNAPQALRVEGGTIPELPAGQEWTEQEKAQLEAVKAERERMVEAATILNDIRNNQKNTASVAAAAGLGAAVALVAIWLGLGLTYLVLTVVAAGAALVAWRVPALEGEARLVLGLVVLSASFAALMEGAKFLLAPGTRVLAIARNVLTEATRMRISVVFMVLLVLLLASLPGWLDPNQPLRYRVQSFLQFGTGLSFWIIATLVLFFSVATVTLEQRQRVIWQTMTKPVRAWEYVLGKWLGVSVLAAVLLLVCGSAVFMFTEYLRGQPAQGEREAYVAPGLIAPDRLVLETQVLAARRVVPADPLAIDPAAFEQQVQERIKRERVANPEFANTETGVAKVRSDLLKAVESEYRTVEPGAGEKFVFSGLGDARGTASPLTLRFKINSGSNRPDLLYNLTLQMPDGSLRVEQVALGQMSSVQFTPSLITPEGTFEVVLANGDVRTGKANAETFTIPPDGLEVSFSAGGFRANFLRVCLVLWVKLAFLAMLGVTCGTFLSFSVAALVAFGTFIAAEGAPFIKSALESWSAADEKGNINPIYWVFEKISQTVVAVFDVYAELRPTARLVDGVLLSWGDVTTGTLVLVVWTALLFVAGGLILSRRELAMYSGQ